MQIQFIANLLPSNDRVKSIVEKYLKDKNLLIVVDDNITKNIIKLIERELFELVVSKTYVFIKYNYYDNIISKLNVSIDIIIITITNYYFNNLKL
jgi:pentose-5-phosphate-3-epimerase